MNRLGPIIFIDDDTDDLFLFEQSLKRLNYPNPVLHFADGEKALEFLNGEGKNLTPFLIISDVNMPRLDGFSLRDQVRMDAELQIRCIPYLFFSTAVSRDAVISAYSKSVQGFFMKQNSMGELDATIDAIMKYWLRCAAPNNFSTESNQ